MPRKHHDSNPGWRAELDLSIEARARGSVLATKRQRGPLTVQRPFHPEGAPCHLYLLHPPGGVVGGDSLSITMDIADQGHALATTPGAAKFYRSAGPMAEQRQDLRVARGGTLEWLPMENILFPGARVRTRTYIHLAAGARFLGWELMSLGRPVIAERFTNGTLDASVSVYREGCPILLDRLRIQDRGDLDGPSGLRGYPVCATLIASGAAAPDVEAARDAARAPSQVLLGITLMEDLLIVRALAHSIEPVHWLLRRIWSELRPRLIGRPPCPPRIWAT